MTGNTWTFDLSRKRIYESQLYECYCRIISKGIFGLNVIKMGSIYYHYLKKKQKQKQKMSSIYNTPTDIIKLRHSFFLQEEVMQCS